MPTGASSTMSWRRASRRRRPDHRHALVRDAVVGEIGHLRRHHDQPGARQLARERDHAVLVHPLVVDAVRDDQPAPARSGRAGGRCARETRPPGAVDGEVLLDQRVGAGLGRRAGARGRTTAPSASCRPASSGGRATTPAPRRRRANASAVTARARLRIGAEICHASAPRSATGQENTKFYDSVTRASAAPGDRQASTWRSDGKPRWARTGNGHDNCGASGGGLAPAALAE